MVLRGGTLAVALKLQEAADTLSANDIRTRLSDCISDCYRGSGKWAYYVDHFGDSETGDVIYSCDGDVMRAGYEISGGTGTAAKCVIDFEQAEDVMPRTVYEVEQDEEDHYAQMGESFTRESLYTELPLYERFISKAEREKAGADDFAGKGRSFPILKPDDVMAAVRSIGRAGSGNVGPSAIKARIIAIAKRKGWEKYLPKSWRGEGDAAAGKESAAHTATQGTGRGGLRLVESAVMDACDVLLKESSGRRIPIKLISPGEGSTAFYPAEVLKRDGPEVFKAGTHVYANHPTAAEEAARPEGDVHNLAGALAIGAEWRESFLHKGKDLGPGLYSEVEPFSDHEALFTEKGGYLGMSIRAGGNAEAGRKSPAGKPILKELTYAESVDVVTKAGRGGMILTEAARTAANSNEGDNADMDAAELKKLQESNAMLLNRALRADAREEAGRILAGITLHEAFKGEVLTNVLKGEIPQLDGALDVPKFTAAVEAEAKRIGAVAAAVTNSGRVLHMGASQPVKATEAAQPTAQQTEAETKRLRESAVQTYRDLGMPQAAAEAAADRFLREVA